MNNRGSVYDAFGLLLAVATVAFGVLIIAYPGMLRISLGIYLILAGLYALIPRLRVNL